MSETPILDLEMEPPNTRLQWVVWLVASPITLAIFLAPLVADKISPDAPAFNALLWLPAIYVGIAIHEIGHLLAGQLVGMKPGGIYVGGFMFFKSGPRWVFRFDLRQCIALGFAKPLPDGNDFRRDPFAWMVAGGPIATFLFTGLCALAVFAFGGGTWDWIGTLFWGATLPLTSVIPFTGNGIMSDGALLWQLLMDPARSRRWIALLAIQTQETNGVMPREWNPELMEEILSGSDRDAFYPQVQMYAFYRCAQQRQTEESLRHLENALATASRGGNKAIRRWCFLEAACASARDRRNAQKARIWLERASKIEKPEWTDSVDAEIAMVDGRYEDAIRHLAAARDLIARKRLDSGIARFAKERFAEDEDECRSALSRAEAVTSPFQSEGHRGSSTIKERQPFPWLTIAAIAIAGVTILVAVISR